MSIVGLRLDANGRPVAVDFLSGRPLPKEESDSITLPPSGDTKVNSSDTQPRNPVATQDQ